MNTRQRCGLIIFIAALSAGFYVAGKSTNDIIQLLILLGWTFMGALAFLLPVSKGEDEK